MKNEPVQAILDRYEHDEKYAILVDEYIDEYVDEDCPYTKDDICGILETMDDESIMYILSLHY